MLARLVVLLILILPASSALTVCGVDFTTPAYELNSRGGDTLIYVDVLGNLLIGSSTVHMGLSALSPISAWSDALIIMSGGSPVIAVSPTEANLVGYISGGGVPASVSGDFVVRDRSSGNILAVFSHTGDIFAAGTAVYQGAQAGCPPDERMCNTSTGDIVGRDYYCDISTGSCTYQDTVLEDCSDTCSDTDNGQDFLTAGTVTDKDLCTSGDTSCPSATHPDTCSGDTLTEWYCSDNDAASTAKNCNDYDCTYNCSNYCDPGDGNIHKFCDDYTCSSGACTSSGSQASCGIVETCSGASDSDGGDKPTAQGTCKEYSPCSSSSMTSCPYTPYADSCSGDQLTEYYVSGNTCDSKQHDCVEYACHYCTVENDYRGACVSNLGACHDGYCDFKCTNYGCPSGYHDAGCIG